MCLYVCSMSMCKCIQYAHTLYIYIYIYICIPTVGGLQPLDVQNYRSKFKLLFFFGVSPKQCVSFNFCYFMFFPILS